MVIIATAILFKFIYARQQVGKDGRLVATNGIPTMGELALSAAENPVPIRPASRPNPNSPAHPHGNRKIQV
jgi:hypothetical protein